MKHMSLAALAAVVCAGLVHAQELPVLKSAEKTSYEQVTGYLNPGGNTFVYQNAAQWATTLEALLPAVQNLVLATAARHDQEEAQVVFQLIEAFLKDSGLEQLNGVGVSSIPIGEGLHHNRVYFGHAEGPAKGLLWDVFTQENAPLPLLKSLPADTVLATRIPLRARVAWEWLRKALAKIDNPEFQRDLERALEQMRRGGVDLDSWLASLGGGAGLVLTVAPGAEGAAEPAGAPDQAFMDLAGRASLAVLVEVKDDTIFDGLEAMFQKMNAPIKRQDAGQVKSLTVQQQLPIPGQGPLAIVRFGTYLAFVSNDRIVKALSEGKGGLTGTKEFKRLAAKLPQDGMGFSFLSERLGNELAAAMDKTMAMMRQQMGGGGMESHAGFVIQAATQLKGQGSYAVSRRTKDGVLALNTATFSLSEALIGKSLIGPAMFMGSIPGARVEHRLVEGQGNGNRQRAMNNLKQIGLGLHMHANDFANRFPDDLGVLMEKGYVKGPQIFVVGGSGTAPPPTATQIRGGQCDYLYFGKGQVLAAIANPAQTPIACTKPGLLPGGGINVLYVDGHCVWHQKVPAQVKALIAKAQKRGVVVNKQDVNYARIRGAAFGVHLAKTHPKARLLLLMPPTPKGGPAEALVAGLRASLADKATVVETVTLAPPKDAKGDGWFTGPLVNGKTAAFKGKVDLVVTGMGLPGQGIQTLWFWASKVKVAIAAGDVAGLQRAIQAKLVVAAAAINPEVVPDDWQPPKDLMAAFAKRYLLITPENVQALAQKHAKLFR